jgi:hypothetical protein
MPWKEPQGKVKKVVDPPFFNEKDIVNKISWKFDELLFTIFSSKTCFEYDTWQGSLSYSN